MNKLILALLSVTTIASAAVPANAQNTGVSQTSEQSNITTGNYNTTTQRTSQTITKEKRRGERGANTAIIQNSRQISDTAGDGNTSVQQGRQTYEQKGKYPHN
ncbi:MAG: hypothetical protein PT116_18235 [Aphanizomenon gracile PMC638.10]|jgi:hypothetical protein|nr:hypothetical protein [Aphanizomenon gracile PMC638.10]